MIKYINISLINFDKLSYKEKKENSFEEFLEKTPISNEEKILLKLKYS